MANERASLPPLEIRVRNARRKSCATSVFVMSSVVNAPERPRKARGLGTETHNGMYDMSPRPIMASSNTGPIRTPEVGWWIFCRLLTKNGLELKETQCLPIGCSGSPVEPSGHLASVKLLDPKGLLLQIIGVYMPADS